MRKNNKEIKGKIEERNIELKERKNRKKERTRVQIKGCVITLSIKEFEKKWK